MLDGRPRRQLLSRCYGSPTIRTLARCRRLLLEVYALPEGTLPPELNDAIEELLMPGFRERVLAAYLEGLTPGGRGTIRTRLRRRAGPKPGWLSPSG